MSRLLCVALLSIVAASAHARSQALDALMHFFDDVRTYTAHFDQVVLDEGLNTIQESSGTLWIQRPGKFRWEYDPPDGQVIVGDGEKVWFYDAELEQVTVRRMAGALGETPAVLLAGRGRLEDRFRIRDLGRQGRLDWVRLVPRRKESGFEDIRVGFEDGRLMTLELTDSLGQVTRITLRTPRENPRLAPERFVFRAPEGVDVLDAGD